MSKWLIAVDESDVASYAFAYIASKMNKGTDHLYIMNVHDEPSLVYGGYATPDVLTSLIDAQDKKSKKVLVHYGHKAKELGIHFTLMKGSSSHAGELICRAVKQYHISHVVTGRRALGTIERFFVGSTSQYIVENAECNVIVVKLPPGPQEEHSDKTKIIQLEEAERIRRVEEEHKIDQLAEDERKKELEQVNALEEEERKRRIEEAKKTGIHLYQFH
uniref:UspA domain-containing protein n=1 Tax=Arcella intermedia TaxID=1963864 RepID=A0A6B2LI91_9EUKA